MRIAISIRLIVASLLTLLVLAFVVPSLPRGTGRGTVWDAGSYLGLAAMFLPLICIYVGSRRYRFIEGVGWCLLLLFVISCIL